MSIGRCFFREFGYLIKNKGIEPPVPYVAIDINTLYMMLHSVRKGKPHIPCQI